MGRENRRRRRERIEEWRPPQWTAGRTVQLQETDVCERVLRLHLEVIVREEDERWLGDEMGRD